MPLPTVTVGFFPRERFSDAGKALRAIVDNTEIPYRLLIVDCDTPERYLGEMREAVAGLTNVTWLHTDEYLRPNQSKNLVCRNTTDDYVCLIENDCYVKKGWLSAMVDECERTGAGAAYTMLYEGPEWARYVHHDRGCAEIRTRVEDGRTIYTVVGDQLGLNGRWKETETRPSNAMEDHCVLYRRSTLEMIGPFIEEYSVNTNVETSVALIDHGIAMLLVPKAVVCYYPPTFVHEDERAYYAFRWDMDFARRGEALLASRRAIEHAPDALDFAHGQWFRTNPVQWFAYRMWVLPRRLTTGLREGTLFPKKNKEKTPA